MKCPYCNNEMKAGYLHDASQPVQWIPDGKKPSVWKSGLADGAVQLGDGSLWKNYRAAAFYCPKCKIVIAKAK